MCYRGFDVNRNGVSYLTVPVVVWRHVYVMNLSQIRNTPEKKRKWVVHSSAYFTSNNVQCKQS